VRRVALLLALVLTFIVTAGSARTFALTTSDIEDILNHHTYFNQNEATCGGTAAPSGPSGPTGSYDPLSLRFPAFPDEKALGVAIDEYIRETAPSSPWLTMPGVPSVGEWLIAESKLRDINPLFVFASGKIENGFGTSGSAPSYNNFFGMKANSTDYRRFATPQEGMQAFMDAVQRNTQSGEGRYAAAQTIYEYFSIHQTGSIVYPGEPFDPGDIDEKKGITADLYDPSMGVWISWNPNANSGNSNPSERGMYNPLIYYRSNIEAINAVTGMNLNSESPPKPGGSAVANCPHDAAGRISVNGYAFPLAPQTKAVGGIKVGQTVTAHHDGTPAFDLFSTEDSAPVFAIYGGTAVTINKSYHGVSGCSTIQFQADDGFYYWYGHLKNVSIEEDVHVEAGTQIAEVADAQNFGSDCWGGGPHLHIDRGCTINGEPQRGGLDECRDPEFIPFLSALFETLEG
jgi:murein DD-endopeptidase MepM/ murein hydrolase activator NlpD